MFIPDERILRRILKLSLAGTRGGAARLKVLQLLAERPRNVNELATELGVDYKTAQYHVRVLLRSSLISGSDQKYANAYQLAAILRATPALLAEVAADMGKRR